MVPSLPPLPSYSPVPADLSRERERAVVLGCLFRLGLDPGLLSAPQQSAALSTGAAATTDARVPPAQDGAMASSCILPALREHQLGTPSSKMWSNFCTISFNGCYVGAQSRHTICRGFKITSPVCCTRLARRDLSLGKQLPFQTSISQKLCEAE